MADGAGGTVRVRPALPHEINAFYLTNYEAHALEIDGEIVAMASLGERDGHLWAALDIGPKAARRPLRLARAVLRYLHSQNRSTRVQCDSPDAWRLLLFLGFVPTGEVYAGKEVWLWPKWP